MDQVVQMRSTNVPTELVGAQVHKICGEKESRADNVSFVSFAGNVHRQKVQTSLTKIRQFSQGMSAPRKFVVAQIEYLERFKSFFHFCGELFRVLHKG